MFAPSPTAPPHTGSSSAPASAPARHCRRHLHDADAHASSLRSWDQHYEQLSSGRYDGTLEDLQTGPVQLFVEQASQATWQSGQPRAHTCTLGVLRAAETGGHYGGHALHGEHLVVMPPGSEFSLVAGAGMQVTALCIDTAHLQAVAQRLQGDDRPLALPEAAAVIAAPAADTAALRALIDCGLDLARHQPTWLQQAAAQRMLTASMADAMLSALPWAAQACELPTRAATRRHIVDHARAHMAEHADEPLSVPDLCAAVGVSRRALQYAFEDVLQLSPVTYLRVMRLNRVRHALLSEPECTVGDVAARWGFWHPSRFAADYRALFGELPSATRALSASALPLAA